MIDRAKTFLRERRPFIWNSTNLSKQMRGKTLDLLHGYGARTKLVYLEAGESEIMSRNSKRDTTLSNSKLLEMTRKWEVPTADESYELDVSFLEKACESKKGKSSKP